MRWVKVNIDGVIRECPKHSAYRGLYTGSC